MELRQYLDLLNKVAVRKADCFKFEDAIEFQKRNIKAQMCIKSGIEEAGRCIGADSPANTRIIPLARALSSLPGYMVLHDRHCPDREICELYEGALREFGSDIGNRMITICHMMHYAITSGNRNQFEMLVREYFHESQPFTTNQLEMKDTVNVASTPNESKSHGNTDLPANGDSDALGMLGVRHSFKSQCGTPANGDPDALGILEEFLVAFANKKSRNSFGLFAAVKGIYAFYSNAMSGRGWDALRYIGESVLPETNATDPVMLIFKYIGLLEWNRKGEVTAFASEMFSKALSCVKEGIIDWDDKLNIYMLISYQTSAIYNELIGEGESNEALRMQLRAQAVRDGWTELVSALDGGAKLSDLLCWEYA